MKTTIIISLLCLATFGAYAQNNTQDKTCKRYPDMPANAVPAWPKGPYISMQKNPECAPCYEYTSKHGIAVMECPGLIFLPDNTTTGTQEAIDNMDIRSSNSYTGNYPKACRRDPDMPKGAKPAWPTGQYTSLQSDANCAPCYEYTSKHGIAVMECPFAVFPPEK